MVPQEPGPGESDRLCPRCRVALFEGRIAESSLLGCGACGGVWLDVAASQAVVLGAARNLTALAEQAAARPAAAPDRSVGGLLCPCCPAELRRVRVAGTTIDLDSCASHGTWFDAGELRAVALAFAPIPEAMRFRPEDYETIEERRTWLTPNLFGWELDKHGTWMYVGPRESAWERRQRELGADDAAVLVHGAVSFVRGVVRGLGSGS